MARSSVTPRPYVARRIAYEQRLAKEAVCPKCRARVLTGPDRDDVAYVAAVDPVPVDPKWEDAAHESGRQAYDLDNGALWFREPWHRGWHEFPMYVSHICLPLA